MSAVSAPPTKRLAYTCTGCTYGITVVRPPERCPMCGGRIWKPDARR